MKQQRDDRALVEARATAEEYERAHAEEDGEDAAAAAAHDQVKQQHGRLSPYRRRACLPYS